MATDTIINLLIAERDKLNRAIEALEAPVRRRGRPPGRGRPPKAGPASIGSSPSRRARRKGMSQAAKKRQSERMIAFWAARRKEKAKAMKQARAK